MGKQVMHNQRTLPQLIADWLLGIHAEVLNPPVPGATASLSEQRLDVLLKQHTARIKAEAIDAATSQVDYTYLKNSDAYREYRQLTASLPAFDLATLASREQKLAFWLNLYNALVIDGIIHYGIRKTANEIPGFFRRAAYQVGDYRFCLDDIEHGILRANAGHIIIPGPQFTLNDPRCSFVLDQADFRIHFALVCGAASCPPVRFYDPPKIDAQLDLAARNFVGQEMEVEADRQTVRLSKLLQWYGEDFGAGRWMKMGIGNRRHLLETLKPYMPGEALNEIAGFRRLRVYFKPYDWSLNAV